MKKFYSIFAFVFFLLLSSCAVNVRISERAIVKAICLDYKNGEYIADIAVFTSEQDSKPSESSEQAKIYNGIGANIAQAIRDCEIKQNKKPFYSQNELLLLTSEISKEKGKDVLDYFNRQNVMGQDLAILVHSGTEPLSDGESLVNIIIDAQRIASASTQSKGVKRLYEYKACGSAIEGYIPTVKISQGSCKESGIVMNYPNGEAIFADLPTARLVQLLDKRLKVLELGKTGAKADTLGISYEAELREGEPYLTVNLSACVYLQTGDKNISDINAGLEDALVKIVNATFNDKNDIFNFCNRMRALDTKKTDDLILTGDMFVPNRVQIKVKLMAT